MCCLREGIPALSGRGGCQLGSIALEIFHVQLPSPLLQKLPHDLGVDNNAVGDQHGGSFSKAFGQVVHVPGSLGTGLEVIVDRFRCGLPAGKQVLRKRWNCHGSLVVLEHYWKPGFRYGGLRPLGPVSKRSWRPREGSSPRLWKTDRHGSPACDWNRGRSVMAEKRLGLLKIDAALWVETRTGSVITSTFDDASCALFFQLARLHSGGGGSGVMERSP